MHPPVQLITCTQLNNCLETPLIYWKQIDKLHVCKSAWLTNCMFAKVQNWKTASLQNVTSKNCKDGWPFWATVDASVMCSVTCRDWNHRYYYRLMYVLKSIISMLKWTQCCGILVLVIFNIMYYIPNYRLLVDYFQLTIIVL